MERKVYGTLRGEVTPPPSKSQAHRLLICAALGTKPCTIVCSSVNDDIMATARCLNALGAEIKYSGGLFTISPVVPRKGVVLDCGESGSTLRFLLPVAAVLGADATFVGGGKLPSRPMGALCTALEQHGITFTKESVAAELPLHCSGSLSGGHYTLPGNVSSQYLTGLLFALPLAAAESKVEVVGGLTSASYVDMTLDALGSAGIDIAKRGDCYSIGGNQQYALPSRVVVESDWSSAAFWVVAGVVGKNPVVVKGVNEASLQGDRRIIDHLRLMGACIEVTPDGVVANPSHLFGAEIDCADTPDLVPILSVAAAVAQGETTFLNVGRLRYKESDRLAAMQAMLASFGIVSVVGEDTFRVLGGEPSVASVVDSFGDHRIAMSAAVLSTVSGSAATIAGAECVAKSYPSFFEDFAALGGEVF